jgi:flagellar basal-body rod modification protein FlgD
MSSVDATSSSTASTYTAATERVPKKSLGQEEFFKLLSVQLASQDPLKPMEDTDFIAQMSSFSSLEMTNDLVKAFNSFTQQQEFSAAQTLIGRQVTLTDPLNTEVSGVVSAIHKDGDDTLITVNGTDYEVSSVRRVETTATETNSN